MSSIQHRHRMPPETDRQQAVQTSRCPIIARLYPSGSCVVPNIPLDLSQGYTPSRRLATATPRLCCSILAPASSSPTAVSATARPFRARSLREAHLRGRPSWELQPGDASSRSASPLGSEKYPRYVFMPHSDDECVGDDFEKDYLVHLNESPSSMEPLLHRAAIG